MLKVGISWESNPPLRHRSMTTGGRASRLALWSLLAAATLLFAFIGVLGNGSHQMRHYSLPTAHSAVPGLGFDSGAEGVLGGTTSPSGRACFWLGTGQEQQVLIWPDNFYATASPLAVLDGQGHLAATAGEYVVLRGGLAPDTAVRWPGCPVTSSQFVVAEVVTSGT